MKKPKRKKIKNPAAMFGDLGGENSGGERPGAGARLSSMPCPDCGQQVTKIQAVRGQGGCVRKENTVQIESKIDERTKTAYHEAGHVLAYVVFSIPFDRVSSKLSQDEGCWGQVTTEPPREICVLNM